VLAAGVPDPADGPGAGNVGGSAMSTPPADVPPLGNDLAGWFEEDLSREPQWWERGQSFTAGPAGVGDESVIDGMLVDSGPSVVGGSERQDRPPPFRWDPPDTSFSLAVDPRSLHADASTSHWSAGLDAVAGQDAVPDEVLVGTPADDRVDATSGLSSTAAAPVSQPPPSAGAAPRRARFGFDVSRQVSRKGTVYVGGLQPLVGTTDTYGQPTEGRFVTITLTSAQTVNVSGRNQNGQLWNRPVRLKTPLKDKQIVRLRNEAEKKRSGAVQRARFTASRRESPESEGGNERGDGSEVPGGSERLVDKGKRPESSAGPPSAGAAPSPAGFSRFTISRQVQPNGSVHLGGFRRTVGTKDEYDQPTARRFVDVTLTSASTADVSGTNEKNQWWIRALFLNPPLTNDQVAHLRADAKKQNIGAAPRPAGFVPFTVRRTVVSGRVDLDGAAPPVGRWDQYRKLTANQLVTVTVTSASTAEVFGTHQDGQSWNRSVVLTTPLNDNQMAHLRSEAETDIPAKQWGAPQPYPSGLSRRDAEQEEGGRPESAVATDQGDRSGTAEITGSSDNDVSVLAAAIPESGNAVVSFIQQLARMRTWWGQQTNELIYGPALPSPAGDVWATLADDLNALTDVRARGLADLWSQILAQMRLHEALDEYERGRTGLGEVGAVLPQIPDLPTRTLTELDRTVPAQDTPPTDTSPDTIIRAAIAEIDHYGGLSPGIRAQLGESLTSLSPDHKFEWITNLTRTKDTADGDALRDLAELIAKCW
jgi:hypothetical protein